LSRQARKLPLAGGLAFLLVAVPGCEHHFFRARGAIGSQGGGLGTWRSTPIGCSRDPLPGLPPQSQTVATLLWQDPAQFDPWHDQHRATAPNAPLRLELSRGNGGVTANLDTVRVEGVHLDETTCPVLRLTTAEGNPAIQSGRPTLGGELTLDCRVRESRITGTVHFSGCEF
jgi:hypothetical protein